MKILKNQNTGEERPLYKCGHSNCNEIIHLGDDMGYDKNYDVFCSECCDDMFVRRGQIDDDWIDGNSGWEEIMEETFKKTNERNHKMMTDFLLYGDDYKGVVKYNSGKEIEGDGYERWEDGRLVIYTAEKEMPIDHIAMARGFSDGDKIIWADTLEEGSALYKEYHSQIIMEKRDR